MNHRAGGGRTLVIDLNEKPGTKEEFFGIPHKVDLNSYYTYGGAVYTMDISKEGTKYAGKSK